MKAGLRSGGGGTPAPRPKLGDYGYIVLVLSLFYLYSEACWRIASRWRNSSTL
jgi:hypothetical protein